MPVAGFITVLSNRVYLANSRDSPLTRYCFVATYVAFLKGEELNPVLSCAAGTQQLPEICITVIPSKTFECSFIIEYIHIDIYFQICQSICTLAN